MSKSLVNQCKNVFMPAVKKYLQHNMVLYKSGEIHQQVGALEKSNEFDHLKGLFFRRYLACFFWILFYFYLFMTHFMC